MASNLAGCNRVLWQLITEVTSKKSPELIENEIKRNNSKLLKGLLYYQQPKSPIGSQLKNERKLQGDLYNFILQLSKFLNCDELLTHDLFVSYLLYEYRGSKTDIKLILSDQRRFQGLLIKLRDYYYTERLYLLRVIKHMLCYWQEENYEFQQQFSDFLQKAFEQDQLITDILKQYFMVCEQSPPENLVIGHSSIETQQSIWMNQQLNEQCELLEIMLHFYRTFEHPMKSVLQLFTHFKKQDFGRRQLHKHLLSASSETFLQRIGFLQALITIEAMDLDFLYKSFENKSMENHQILKYNEQFQELTLLVNSLSSSSATGPIFLLWAIIEQICGETEKEMQLVRKFGSAALQNNVFQYLDSLLNTEPFNGENPVAIVAHIIIYGLIKLAVNLFAEGTLGDPEPIHKLTNSLLSTKQVHITNDFWQKGLEEGLGIQFYSAISKFPHHFENLVNFSTSLSATGRINSDRVVKLLSELQLYTEPLDCNSASSLRAIQSPSGTTSWQLTLDKTPYPEAAPNFVIHAGTTGQIEETSDSQYPVIQWQTVYSAWELFICELKQLIELSSRGSCLVSSSNIRKSTCITKLLSTVLSSNSHNSKIFEDFSNHLFTIIQRFSIFNSCPLDLIANCLNCLAVFRTSFPKMVWHNLKQTGFLATFTEKIDSSIDKSANTTLNLGLYGPILIGQECPKGYYPITLSFLNLIASLIQPLHLTGDTEELVPSICLINREIFSKFDKWRYYERDYKEKIGQRCLEVFHKVLNLKELDSDSNLFICDICIYNLLYTESGPSLLQIISIGVEAIELALAGQGSAFEGSGIQLIHMIRLSFSVLNRLLLLRPDSQHSSPLEQCLSVKPVSLTHRHPVAVIGQYLYHRHDSRLPILAILLLKRIAVVFPMSILACLAEESSSFRDVVLTRLQARTEDVRLKVVILEFLSVCVDTQPGLIETFLNLPLFRPHVSTTEQKSAGASSSLAGCLQATLSLIREDRQGSYHCPSALLAAILEFYHSLWHNHREAALAVLRDSPNFWCCVCLSLTKSLPEPTISNEEKLSQITMEVQVCMNIFKILSLELYQKQRNISLSKNFVNVWDELISEQRLEYWSKYINMLVVFNAQHSEGLTKDVSKHVYSLLISWKNLMLTLSSQQDAPCTLKASTKEQILLDILSSMAVYVGEVSLFQQRIMSVLSTLFLPLFKNWISYVQDPPFILKSLTNILLDNTNTETLLPSLQIGILGSLTCHLHHFTSESSDILVLLPPVCSILHHSTYSLPHPSQLKCDSTSIKKLSPSLKLQIICCCLLEQIIKNLKDAEQWISILQEHSIIHNLTLSAQTWILAKQGVDYVGAVLNLFQTLTKFPQAAEMLVLNNVNHLLCLALVNTYDQEKNTCQVKTPELRVSWVDVYLLYMSVCTSLLKTLKFRFLDEALNFLGVHQDRMHECLDKATFKLTYQSLSEAEETCRFLAALSTYRRQWRLHLPQTQNKLLSKLCELCQSCVSLLIRPKLLQHLIQRNSGFENGSNLQRDTIDPVVRRLLHSTSELDDCVTSESIGIQEKIMNTLAQILSTLMHYTPRLYEILLDQSLDVAEFEPFVQVNFSTPSMESNQMPNFGTFISCNNICTRLLARCESKSSPSKSPISQISIKKDLVMFILENSSYIIMSQAVRYLREPSLSPRDKQILKRELAAELNSFLMGIQRYFKRIPQSPINDTSNLKTHSARLSSSVTSSSSHQQEFLYFQLIDNFCKKVLR